jgi:hypothetical protein
MAADIVTQVSPAPSIEHGAPTEIRSLSERWLWPNQNDAAQILGVSKSTMSRQRVEQVSYGQERRIAPTTVMWLADHFGRRPIGEVGAGLVELGRMRMRDRAELAELEEDVARYLAVTRASDRAAVGDAWLEEARHRLPADLYERVVAATQPPEGFSPVRFDDEDDG